MKFYYLDAQRQTIGPLTWDELMRLNALNVVLAETLVVPHGGQQWIPFSVMLAQANSGAAGPVAAGDLQAELAALNALPATEPAQGYPLPEPFGATLAAPANAFPGTPGNSGGSGNSGMAISSMVLGIASLFGFSLLVFPPILAVVFGILSLKDFKRNPQLQGRGMAIAGIATGSVALLFGMLMVVAAVALPKFLGLSDKANFSEAPTALKQFEMMQRAHLAENDRTGSFEEIGFAPTGSEYFRYGELAQGMAGAILQKSLGDCTFVGEVVLVVEIVPGENQVQRRVRSGCEGLLPAATEYAVSEAELIGHSPLGIEEDGDYEGDGDSDDGGQAPFAEVPNQEGAEASNGAEPGTGAEDATPVDTAAAATDTAASN